MFQNYKINYADSFKEDVREIVKYTVKTFNYNNYKTVFKKKTQKAVNKIKNSATSIGETNFLYDGEIIYMRCIDGFLYFYIVVNKKITFIKLFKDGQDWKRKLSIWLKSNT